MLSYFTARSFHLAQAQAQMASLYRHAYALPQPQAHSAYGLCICWLAEYARTHPRWVDELEDVIKKPVVDAIVAELGLGGVECILASVFVGVLLDVLFAWMLRGETGRTSSERMFQGSILDTVGRWASELGR